eukprot:141801-Pyramimonas_sp.AAC.1
MGRFHSWAISASMRMLKITPTAWWNFRWAHCGLRRVNLLARFFDQANRVGLLEGSQERDRPVPLERALVS